MRRRGTIRALRGLVAGLLTTFLALLFHVLGGGVVPSPLAIAICTVAAVWAAVLIGRARPSLPLLIVAVAAAQLLLHTAFAMTTSTATLTGIAVSGTTHAGHMDGGLVVAAGGHGGGAMWLAHVVAGVITIVAIRRGERALRGLADAGRVAVRRLVALLVPVVPARPARRPTADLIGAAARLARLAAGIGSGLVRRGPPPLAA